jgi:hypothetical protein
MLETAFDNFSYGPWAFLQYNISLLGWETGGSYLRIPLDGREDWGFPQDIKIFFSSGLSLDFDNPTILRYLVGNNHETQCVVYIFYLPKVHGSILYTINNRQKRKELGIKGVIPSDGDHEES